MTLTQYIVIIVFSIFFGVTLLVIIRDILRDYKWK